MPLLLIVRTAFEKMSHRVPEGGGLNVVDVQVHQRIRPSVALVRAVALATRHPDHREQILAFATHQAAANAHIDQNLLDAVWVLRRSDV